MTNEESQDDLSTLWAINEESQDDTQGSTRDKGHAPKEYQSHSRDEALAKKGRFAYTVTCNNCCINLRNKCFLGEKQYDKHNWKTW